VTIVSPAQWRVAWLLPAAPLCDGSCAAPQWHSAPHPLCDHLPADLEELALCVDVDVDGLGRLG